MKQNNVDLYQPTGNEDIDSMFEWLQKVENLVNFISDHQYAIAGLMGMSLIGFLYVFVGRRDVKSANNKYKYNKRNYR